MSTAASGLTRHLVLDRVPMLNVCFGLHRRGSGDPTHRTLGGIHLRTTRVPTGPALLKVVAQGNEVSARAWGDGAEQVLDHLPRLLGEHDDLGGFEPRHPVDRRRAPPLRPLPGRAVGRRVRGAGARPASSRW